MQWSIIFQTANVGTHHNQYMSFNHPNKLSITNVAHLKVGRATPWCMLQEFGTEKKGKGQPHALRQAMN